MYIDTYIHVCEPCDEEGWGHGNQSRQTIQIKGPPQSLDRENREVKPRKPQGKTAEA